MRDPHGRCDMPGLSIIIRWSAQHNKSSQLCCIALHLSTSIPDWRTHRCEEEAKERHYSAWYWRAACRVHKGYAVSLRQHEAEARLLGRHKTRNSVTSPTIRSTLSFSSRNVILRTSRAQCSFHSCSRTTMSPTMRTLKLIKHPLTAREAP